MTFDPQLIAGILLALRLLAIGLIGAVVVRQIHNLRRLHTDYPAVRWTVFALTVVLLLGQIIPTLLDLAVLLYGGYGGRTSDPHIIGVAYAVNNALGSVIFGALLCFLYFRLATPPKIANDPAMDGKVPQPENTPIPEND